MVERQLKRRGITEQRIIDAFRAVPREAFVGASRASCVWRSPAADRGRTNDLAALYRRADDPGRGIKAGDTVLEVGAGSGYAAAVIGRIAARVIGIERQRDLVDAARQRLGALGCDNVEIVEGDGTRGWSGAAPYDAILAAASGSHVPEPSSASLHPRALWSCRSASRRRFSGSSRSPGPAANRFSSRTLAGCVSFP